eukprot:4742789-Amphidinium_carterae.3
MQDSHDRLNQEKTAKYCSVAGSVLYLSLDRPDLKQLCYHGGEDGCKSTDAVVAFLGMHLIDSSCSTQQVVYRGIRILRSRERHSLWIADKTRVGADGGERKAEAAD